MFSASTNHASCVGRCCCLRWASTAPHTAHARDREGEGDDAGDRPALPLEMVIEEPEPESPYNSECDCDRDRHAHVLSITQHCPAAHAGLCVLLGVATGRGLLGRLPVAFRTGLPGSEGQLNLPAFRLPRQPSSLLFLLFYLTAPRPRPRKTREFALPLRGGMFLAGSGVRESEGNGDGIRETRTDSAKSAQAC